MRDDLWAGIRWLLVFSVATNMLLLAMPIHMIAVYDRVLTSQSTETLLYITLMALVALALLGVGEAVRMMIAQRLSARFVTGTAGPLFSGIIHASHTDVPKSQLMRDFYAMRTFLSGRGLISLFDLPFAPFFLLLLFALHVQLGLLTAFGMLLLAGLAWANRSLSKGDSEEATRANADAVSFSQALVARSEDIRAMGLFPAFLARWGSKMDEALTQADRTAQLQAVFTGLSRSVRQALQVIIMAWGAYLVLGGDLSGGVIFAASLISGRAFMPIEQVIGSWDRIVHARQAYANLNDFLESRTNPPRAVVPRMTVGDLDLENVGFDVAVGTRTQTIVSGITFSVPSGSVLAIIGPSGAGKTTLAKLLVGALKPTSGSVRLDDFELTLWPDARRGESIGYVPQEARTFPGSIAENISRFEEHPDEDAIIEAARHAGLHDTVARLPEAYATRVSSDGAELSGGRLQQVALARAFYGQPRVMVLDEANAHLDATAEDNLMRTLARSRDQGVSSVVVSQRRSILKIADFVCTMNEGRVVEFRENRGQWRARHSDDRPSQADPANGSAKPEISVQALNARAPRRAGTMKVEGQ